MNILEVDRISKTFDDKPVISNLSFGLKKGEIGCLLGESGCGKTTALRCIAGFESLKSGTISINAKKVSSPENSLSPERRNVGMVFQDYALFPHLTVEKNIAFGLGGFPSTQRVQRVKEMLDLVALSPDGLKLPHELSGGQQQRVALARALAPGPDLLLLDEPFSNLDVVLRERLSMEVGQIIREMGISALLVTHNQNEAFAMADRIGVMHQGHLTQWGSAHTLYHRPETPFVAKFVGEGVFIPGRLVEKDELKTPLGTITGKILRPGHYATTGRVLVRPEDVVHDDQSPLKATIIKKHFRGAQILYTLKLAGGHELLCLVPSHHNHNLGDPMGIRVLMDDIVLFD